MGIRHAVFAIGCFFAVTAVTPAEGAPWSALFRGAKKANSAAKVARASSNAADANWTWWGVVSGSRAAKKLYDTQKTDSTGDSRAPAVGIDHTRDKLLGIVKQPNGSPAPARRGNEPTGYGLLMAPVFIVLPVFLLFWGLHKANAARSSAATRS